MKRIQMGRRLADPEKYVDATRYVFMCLMCPWQVQAGYAARRDFGPRGLFQAIGMAHAEHIKEVHVDDADIELEWADGHTHGVSRKTSEGTTEAALMASPLPRWWVDR